MSDPVDELMDNWRVELPDVLDATSELSKRIMVLGGQLSAVTKAVLPEFGVTLAEFDVLVTLRRVGKPYRLKPNELSRELLLSTGGTSNVVNHLESEGLVEREPDPDDGRSTLIRLTHNGVRLAEAALRANSAAHAAMFADVPPEVARAATDALRELSRAIHTARRSPRRTSPR